MKMRLLNGLIVSWWTRCWCLVLYPWWYHLHQPAWCFYWLHAACFYHWGSGATLHLVLWLVMSVTTVRRLQPLTALWFNTIVVTSFPLLWLRSLLFSILPSCFKRPRLSKRWGGKCRSWSWSQETWSSDQHKACNKQHRAPTNRSLTSSASKWTNTCDSKHTHTLQVWY